MVDDIQIQSEDGWSLEGVHLRGDNRAIVLCGHAMMVNSISFTRGGFAAALARRGYEVYCFDFRGHGRSRPRGGGTGTWSYDDLALRDLPALVSGVCARHPGKALVVVGHSLTGHACLGWLGLEQDARVRAVVAVAANVWLRRLESSRTRWLQKRFLVESWLAASRALGYFPARRLRFGRDDVALPYIRQFAGWARDDAWRTLDGRDYLTALGNVRIPVLGVLGGADRLYCTPQSGRRFLSYLGSDDVTIWEIGEREIPGLRPDHMRLIVDRHAAPVWERIAGWIDERTRD